MKQILFSLIITFTFCVHAQELNIVKYSDLQDKIENTSSGLTVFNFWATWCAPCVSELPYLDELESEFKNLKVYLVNLDFKQDINKVEKVIKQNKIKSEVLFLDEKDIGNYLSKVSDEWTGAIPATLFVSNNGNNYFYEKFLAKEDLQRIVRKHID